jgi:hypothetical protein
MLCVLRTSDEKLLRRSLDVLARVVRPVMRCADFQVEEVAASSWRWLERLTEFHELPT